MIPLLTIQGNYMKVALEYVSKLRKIKAITYLSGLGGI